MWCRSASAFSRQSLLPPTSSAQFAVDFISFFISLSVRPFCCWLSYLYSSQSPNKNVQAQGVRRRSRHDQGNQGIMYLPTDGLKICRPTYLFEWYRPMHQVGGTSMRCFSLSGVCKKKKYYAFNFTSCSYFLMGLSLLRVPLTTYYVTLRMSHISIIVLRHSSICSCSL